MADAMGPREADPRETKGTRMGIGAEISGAGRGGDRPREVR
ncbi:hypothetical protein C8K36_108152 [Rhodococcus sp. OK519]|nr:hypothetical protein C8K36_108152 [Rhodococcus sp. OK519]